MQSLDPHGYVQDDAPRLLAHFISRGNSAAGRAGEMGQALVDGFDREMRRRVATGTFYGSMLFLSLTARKIDGAP